MIARSRSFTPVLFVLAFAALPFRGTVKAAEANAAKSGNASVSVRLTLPKTIYAVPGVETNIYFANVILAIDPRQYVFDVQCAKGLQQAERWTFTPKPQDVKT